MSEGLKFGIICTAGVLQKWQASAIRLLAENGHELKLAIIDGRNTGGHLKDASSPGSERDLFIWRICNRFFFKPPQRKPVKIEKDIEPSRKMLCLVSEKNNGEYFSEQDIREITSAELDFILQFGFNNLRGGILDTAKYGIWSFHHGDEEKYRTGPPGFWEIFNNDPVSAVVMHRLTEQPGTAIILKKAWCHTLLHSFQTNLDVMLWVSAPFPVYLANEISLKGFIFPPPAVNSGTESGLPRNLKITSFLFRLLKNRIKFYWNDLFRAERWNIGIINRSIQELAINHYEIRREDVLWMRERGSRHYFADPSGFMDENKVHILMEDYSYSENKAHISEAVFDPSSKSFSIPLISIESKEHLSYPFVFVYGEDIYCLPSSHRYGYIGLYKRNYSEGAFVEDQILIDHIDAVDPTLINFNDKWWLFFTLRKYCNTHLYLYSADEMYGEYKPHPMNPVKMDIRSARPAGLPFIHEGQLYRPAQDCSESYGKRIAINKVTRLSELEYEEEVESYFGPIKQSKYPKGVHTVFGLGKYTLVDAKRYKFDFHHFGRRAGNRFKKH